jgi:hypothetical protein
MVEMIKGMLVPLGLPGHQPDLPNSSPRQSEHHKPHAVELFGRFHIDTADDAPNLVMGRAIILSVMICECDVVPFRIPANTVAHAV